MPTIDVYLIPGEPPRIEAKGFKGAACLRATEPYEKALGGEVLKRTETAEMRQTTRQRDQIHQRDGQ